MAKVHNHFASTSRVLKRRKEALARMPKVAKIDGPYGADYTETHPRARTQAQLDAERARLTDLIAGGGKKAKFVKAWNVNDKDR